MLIMLVLFIIFKVLVPLFYWINNVIEQWSSNAEMKALARKQQANDKRTRQLIDKGVPAILYLRPFLLDGTHQYSENNYKTVPTVTIKGMVFGGHLPTQQLLSIEKNFELNLAQSTESIGPFVAIGSPRGSKNDFGALRFFYTDEIWQEKATELMQKSRMIYVRLGNIIPDGFDWELHQIRDCYFYKTIFVAHSLQKVGYNQLKNKLKEYNILFPPYKRIEACKELYVAFNEKGQYEFSEKIEELPVYKKSLADARNKL